MAERSHRATAELFVAAAAAAAVLALTAVGVGSALDAEDRADSFELEGLSADLALSIERRVEDLARLAARAAGRTVEQRSPRALDALQVDVPEGATLAFVRDEGDRLSLVEGDAAAETAIAPQLRRAIVVSRDKGRTVVGDVVDVGDARLIPILRPVFDRGAGRLSAEPGADLGEDSRYSVAGYVMVVADAASLLGEETPPGAGARLSDGSGVLAEVGRGPGDSGRVDLRIPISTEQRWTLSVWNTSRPGALPWTALQTAIAGMVVAGIVAYLLLRGRARREQAEREADAANRELRTVTEVGAVLQQSLAVADVLPAVSVRLRDDLDLAGVSISAGGWGEETVEAFAIGAPTDPDVPWCLDLPDDVAAGETVALALQRAGRAVGILRIRADGSLTADELSIVAVVGEQITAALSNALMFETQEAAMHRLRELDDMKNVFLGTASHELVTPTVAFVGFAQLLDRHWDVLSEDRKREFVRRIAANALTLDLLVRDLVDVSRLERGRLEAVIERIDLTAVIEDCLRRIFTAFGDHRFEVDVAEGLSIEGDADAIDRIVTNLVSNAAKFSPPGSTVTFTAHRLENRVVLVVDDEGPGVQPAERSRIFDRFYRGSGDAVLRTRGSGIGLAIVRELADQMGAVVRVADAPSGGARFTVEFGPDVTKAGESPDGEREPIDARST